jgi:hypothetical protein
MVPFIGAASVSWKITAKLVAFAGGLLHEMAGEAALGSAQEYCVGIMEPSVYAELISLNLDGGGGGAPPCCCAAIVAVIATEKMARTTSDCSNLVRIAFPPQAYFGRHNIT